MRTLISQTDSEWTPTGVLSLLVLMAVVLLGSTLLGCMPADSTGAADGQASARAVSAEAFDEVLEIEDTLTRIEQLASLLSASGPEDVELVTAAFDRAVLPQSSLEYGMFGTWWAGIDPLSAFVYADGALAMDHPATILSVVREWARRDPIGAVESDALNELDSQLPAIRESLAQVFVAGWFQSGKPGIEDWIISQDDPRAIKKSFEYYAQMRVVRDGPEATLEWARTAPFEQIDRIALMSGALSVVSHTHPEIAVDFLPNLEAEGVDSRMMMGSIARGWSHHRPREAVEWLLTFPESASRNASIRQGIGLWIRRDEPGFSAWIDENAEEGPSWLDPYRNQAIRAHINQKNFKVDWIDVLDRVQRVKDEDLRKRLRIWALQRWNIVDSAAAHAWIDARGDALEANTKARLLNIPRRQRERVEEAIRFMKEG